MHQQRLNGRAPLERELNFLESLAQGPRTVVEGPLGRCLKRGWCARVSPNNDDASHPAIYAITPEGLNAISLAASGQIRIRKR